MEWEEMIAHFLAYEMADLIRLLSLIIAFLFVGVFADRNTWTVTDNLVTLGLGASLFFAPKLFLEFMVKGSLTDSHLLLARISAGAYIGAAVHRHLTKESRDGTVHITVLLSRVFMWSTVLVCQVYSHFYSNRGKKTVQWNDEFVKMGIFGSVLMLLGNFIHLLRSNDFMTYPQCNIRLNTHLRLDAWLMTLGAVAMLAAPDFFTSTLMGIKTPTCVQSHLVRCIGALDLGEAFISVQAPGFLHEADKRAQLFSRVVSVMLTLLPGIWGCYGTGHVITQTQLLYITASLTPSFLNALFGYVLDGTTIYKVPNRDEKSSSYAQSHTSDNSYSQKLD